MSAVPTGQVTGKNPIINDPFVEPARHWEFGAGEPTVAEGRRPAGYLPPVVKGGQLQITDQVIVMELVNRIRDRVREWREGGYAGATAITRDLFELWFDPEREAGTRPFFAQQEAMETIAFLTEATADRHVGITIPKFEPYERWAIKLATGAGKTLVMAMTIAWSGLNKAAARQDNRFADAFLVVCPNLTVKERLSGDDGLVPSAPTSAYRGFGLIPGNLEALFGRVRVMVTNWHALAEETDPRRSVLRRGPESDAAFSRRVLRDLGDKSRIMVLNDEAHHAWRPPVALHLVGEEKREAEEATVWIRGLERIDNARTILRALDFSATPMYPGAVKDKAWQPFEWVVADFSLVDAIESGLVKIPRIPTEDNTGRAIPKYRNLWDHVRKVLPKRGDDAESEHPLTDYLIEVDGPLKQLSGEWERTFTAWRDAGRHVPPVMIVVTNETKMAEILDRHIAVLGEAGPELRNNDVRQVTVRIDSKLLADAEARDDAETASDAAERIRALVATVGKEAQPGEQVRCLISVAMLSEGWDARNVTQILGLRAFQSQLLCEQVVGRGLRRTDYTDLSRPEYVDVYGVPFQLLPFAKADAGTPIEPPRTTQVHTITERANCRLEFPRVVQIVSDVGETLTVDIDAIEPIRVSAEFDPTETWMEFEAGLPGQGLGLEIHDREVAYERFRMQRLLFRVAAAVIAPFDKPWLFPDALKIVERVVAEKVDYGKGVDRRELCNLRYMEQLRQRISDSIRPEAGSTDRLLPVLDSYDPIGSTDRIAFVTAKPCELTMKSHISHVVADSKLEVQIAHELEQDDRVLAYAKNDRLFLEIPYRFLGRTLRYRPDFLVKLGDGEMLLIEGKGKADEKDDAKATAARRWVAAVNSWGKLGRWEHAICYKRTEVDPAITAAVRRLRPEQP
ncbi:MAG: DEAD/DEAH box helicase family protein [Actinomycetota bacterium]|nr:DEAD/DEAH box helicase family protein [Actinomycetota bacterium]